MHEPISNWPRSQFRKPGGRPFLFYVVFGKFENHPVFSPNMYRSGGIPVGFDLLHYDSVQHPAVLTRFQDGYLWDRLRADDPKLASEIATCNECIILRDEIEDCDSLNYFRDSVGLLTYLLDNGGSHDFRPAYVSLVATGNLAKADF